VLLNGEIVPNFPNCNKHFISERYIYIYISFEAVFVFFKDVFFPIILHSVPPLHYCFHHVFANECLRLSDNTRVSSLLERSSTRIINVECLSI
jgi:hypothetical protein